MRALWWGLTGLALVATGLSSGAGVAAERDVFRCVYPDGRIEFRGTPLQGADCVTVDRWQMAVPPSAPISDDSASEPTPDATLHAEQEDPWVRNCEVARDNVTLLEYDGPVVETGADGRPVLLSDSDRAERLSQARRDVEYWCNPRR